MDDVHILGTVVKDGSGIEITLTFGRSTTTENLGSLLHGVVHLLRNALQSCLLYQRTHVHILFDGRVTELYSLELLHDDIGELLLDILVNINTLGIVTDLTGVTDTALQNGLGCQFEVCIWEYDGRSLTTQLKRNLCDVGSSSLHNLHTSTHGTCQAHDANLWMAGQSITNNRTLTCNHIEQTCGQTALMNNLTDFRTVLRGNLSGFDNNRATGNQGSGSLTGNEEEREVPRQNTCSHADRLLHENHRLVGSITLNHLTLNTAGKLCHIIEISGGHTHLNTSKCLSLTLLTNNNFLELVEVSTDTIGNLMQINGTLGSRNLSPLLLGNIGCLYSLIHILYCSGKLTRSHFLRRRVQHFNPLT